ncbi:hypothetical protein DM558_02635 [Entomomonas moraniae]|uniref:Uncharacterized protein n=1 Tax=Entomomonas moraniae TaxID=2213226 RepID=A0A3Q9JLM6_9GAMM|nr:hypothetical protein [Entomomonas moraniae]AZS49744.1 hypothetical protein DM558_02635 [Entomomonas moraniae]
MDTNHYADTAYYSGRIPNQADAHKQPWLQKLAQMRLPWGRAKVNIAPMSLFGDDMSPNIIRLKEQFKQQLTEQNKQLQQQPVVDLAAIAHNQINNDINHQHFIYRPAPRVIRFGLFLWGMGKVGTPLFVGVLIFTYLLVLTVKPFTETNMAFGIVAVLIIVPLLLLWLIGYLIAFKLPEGSARNRRPKWELNRQTGMVTAYTKRDSFSAPFYEWDAYINVIPTNTGTMIGKLYLAHRYQPQVIDLSILAPMGSTTQQLYAAWDFIQTYMDTMQALPDIPLLEEFRTLDPRTVEMDAVTQRQPNYWLNMSDDEWKKQQTFMQSCITHIDTEQRPNLMANYVNYGQ